MTSNAVPFTAFCPDCNAHRTFTLLEGPNIFTSGAQPRIGCCVCGTSERQALVALTDRMQNDRATIGEMAARINNIDGELEELRDDHHALAKRLERHPA